MQTAPPSCRAATKRAPASRSALVTVRLPLPSRPKTTSTPCAASALPIASATSTRRSVDGSPEEDRADHGDDRAEDRDAPAEAGEQRQQCGDHEHQAEETADHHQVVGALLTLAARGPRSGSALEIAHGRESWHLARKAFVS